jgi:hypothetical protein
MSKTTRTICHLLVCSVSYGSPVLSDTITVLVEEAQEFSSINENNHQLTLRMVLICSNNFIPTNDVFECSRKHNSIPFSEGIVSRTHGVANSVWLSCLFFVDI